MVSTINRRGFLKKAIGATVAVALGVVAFLSLKKIPIVKRPSSNFDRLSKIDPSLIQYQQCASWKSFPQRSHLTGIAVSKDHVFIADAGNRIVLHCDSSGKILNYIGKKDKSRNIPGFVVPSPYFDLAVASDGLLRVTNPGRHRIEAYTFDGDFEFAWGKPSSRIEGFCGCCNPVSFAILPDESFVTCEKGLLRVKTYQPNGTFKAVVAGPDQLADGRICQVCTSPAKCGPGGFAVTTDEKGRVFVLDTVKNLVKVFAKT